MYYKMQFVFRCLRLEIHEIWLQENYGKSEETSLCLIFSTFVSLSGLIFQSTQICQHICELC